MAYLHGMKTMLKAEATGLFLLITFIYSIQFPDTWTWYLALFFIPDISFAAYLLSNKWGAYGYNLLHHQGMMSALIAIGWWMEYPLVLKLGLIFMAHSFFDRMFGYGLKYEDSFHHTHLGWIGKQKEPTVNL